MQTRQEIQVIMKNEKDLYLFKSHWLDCCIIRHWGHLNGYVAVPKESELYWMGYHYSDWGEEKLSQIEKQINDIRVHGGLTFADKMNSVSSDKHNFDRCFGFDTAHAWDAFIIPNLPSHLDLIAFEYGEYRDYNYVKAEVESLAEQLHDIIYPDKTQWKQLQPYS